ncbi:MAG: DNA alkylation repair protein [Clostridiales bacterium]|nr:DNA alkylation repair protein [Candidatus Crickella merdequi]
MQAIVDRLFEMQDLKYKEFQCKLIPGIDLDSVIGVRTPKLRAYAKELYKSGDYREFLNELPHKYYDENNLHGFIICQMKDYDQVVEEIDRLLPYVDNWATCDLMRPKAFDRQHDRLIEDIRRWMSSDETYTIRFGEEMLMTFFLDSDFRVEYLEEVATIRSEEYYVNMMTAWFFATALAKQYDATLPFIEGMRLDKWTHNKAIQKACESYRVSDQQKSYLRTLKIK